MMFSEGEMCDVGLFFSLGRVTFERFKQVISYKALVEEDDDDATTLCMIF